MLHGMITFTHRSVRHRLPFLSKLVCICAPPRGDVEKNIAFARQKVQEVFQAGDIPICPQLMFPTSLSQSPLVSVSAYGENSAHSLAPPLPAEPASLGFGLES